MKATRYEIGDDGFGYHIEIKGTPYQAWVENYDIGKGVTWLTSVDPVRAHEIGQAILKHNVPEVTSHDRSGSVEKVALSALKDFIQTRENEVSVLSILNDAEAYDYIWQRNPFERDKTELGIVGQLPSLETIQKLIELTSPEML